MTGPDTLPVPPLRLRRVRLHGVGPDGARFDPLDLDFTTGGGAASRVLLSLTNTGGKSTLITLISSLVVPASRAQVGGKNLGDYLLTGDTAHVVCEWDDTTTGVRTVTGTVMEWKDGRRQPPHKQRSTTNMHRAWYLFRTGAHLPGIDDLPFVVEGRRAAFSTYLDNLTELLTQHPATQWVLTRTQQEWTQALEDHTSIDPVLFGYQMRMNDSEAGAERLLKDFDSPDNVVRFFIAALNDDRDIADFTSKLGHYAELAAKRPRLQALNDFCTTIAPTVEQIADRAVSADKATAAALLVQTAGRELAGAAYARLSQDRSLLAEQEQDLTHRNSGFCNRPPRVRPDQQYRLQTSAGGSASPRRGRARRGCAPYRGSRHRRAGSIGLASSQHRPRCADSPGAPGLGPAGLRARRRRTGSPSCTRRYRYRPPGRPAGRSSSRGAHRRGGRQCTRR